MSYLPMRDHFCVKVSISLSNGWLNFSQRPRPLVAASLRRCLVPSPGNRFSIKAKQNPDGRHPASAGCRQSPFRSEPHAISRPDSFDSIRHDRQRHGCITASLAALSANQSMFFSRKAGARLQASSAVKPFRVSAPVRAGSCSYAKAFRSPSTPSRR